MELSSILRRLHERVAIPLLHRCPPPPDQLLIVLGRIGTQNVWEQRTCPACGLISHWRRDSPHETFELWREILNRAAIRVDMSDRALAD